MLFRSSVILPSCAAGSEMAILLSEPTEASQAIIARARSAIGVAKARYEGRIVQARTKKASV